LSKQKKPVVDRKTISKDRIEQTTKLVERLSQSKNGRATRASKDTLTTPVVKPEIKKKTQLNTFQE
jgi:hypothetical protein